MAKTLTKWIFAVLTAFFCFLILFPISPNVKEPNNDSSVYLCTSKIMLDGGAPYVDSWDHKGPFTYFINAIPWLISPQPAWGLFFLLCLTLIPAALFLLFELLHYFPLPAISVGFAVFFYTLERVFTDNCTEIYTLIMLLAAIAFLLRAGRTGRSLPFLWIGIFGGITLMLKLNQASFWALLFCFLSVDGFRQKRLTKSFLLYGVGLAIPILISFIYLLRKNALAACLDQYLRFNLIYSEGGSPVWKIYKLMENIYTSFGLPLLLMTCAVLLLTFARPKAASAHRAPELRNCLILLLCALPFELFCAGLSTFAFPHYLINLCLSLLMFFSAGADVLLRPFDFDLRDWKQNLLLLGCSALLFVSLTTDALKTLGYEFSKMSDPAYFQRVTVSSQTQYILDNTGPQDTIFQWGNLSEFYLTSGRKNPTKFSYIMPLVNCSYATHEMWAEFNAGLAAGQPRLIIESDNMPFPADEQAPAGCEALADDFAQFFSYLHQNYELTFPSGHGFSRVYVRK